MLKKLLPVICIAALATAPAANAGFFSNAFAAIQAKIEEMREAREAEARRVAQQVAEAALKAKEAAEALAREQAAQALAIAEAAAALALEMLLPNTTQETSHEPEPMDPNADYQPTYESVTQRQLSPWFKDAKLGIFLHYGIYTVPAFGSVDGVTAHAIANVGTLVPALANTFTNDRMAPELGYAEWYASHIYDYKSKSHQDFIDNHFDATLPVNDKNIKSQYYNMIDEFNAANEQWNPRSWVSKIKDAGAKYSVLTAKHHDGVTLFPATAKHDRTPVEQQATQRNIVGEFVSALRDEDLKVGLYYSGYYDWAARDYFNIHGNISKGDVAQAALGDIFVQCDPEIEALYESHLLQLIEDYGPDVLWADIGHVGDPHKIQSALFNANPIAVTNDRWSEPSFSQTFFDVEINLLDIINFQPNIGFFNRSRNATDSSTDNFNVYPYDVDMSGPWRFKSTMDIAKEKCNNNLVANPEPRYDGQFETPEYAESFDLVEPGDYFEASQVFGQSYAYNEEESIEHKSGTDTLAKKFIDIISSGGNLLLNMAVRSDGSVPLNEVEALEGIGTFIQQNESAIYATRPWKEKGRNSWQGHDMRYTTTVDGKLNVFLLNGFDKGMQVSIPHMMAEPGTKAVHLSSGIEITPQNHNVSLSSIDSVELDFRNSAVENLIENKNIDPSVETNIEVIQFQIKKELWEEYLAKPNHWTTRKDNTEQEESPKPVELVTSLVKPVVTLVENLISLIPKTDRSKLVTTKSAQNLIKNGSFEDGTSHWGGFGQKWLVTDAENQQGSSAAKFTTAGGKVYLKQAVALDAHADYEISACLKSESESVGPFLVSVLDIPIEGGNGWGQFFLSSNDDTWRCFSGTFNSGNKTSTEVR
ncbi:MAG: alpha-L-fucosidase, partial [Oleispira sp.]|nr:alpha-L-fucosidase [Oleispira sp.]